MSLPTAHVTAGRPNKIVDDAGATRARIAWLLRMNRLYGQDPELAVARRCAAAFPTRYGTVTPSQISRWENGVLAVPYQVFRAYEDVLGLPEGRLTVAVDAVHQVRSVRAGAPRLDRRFVPGTPLSRQLDDLLDRCTGDGPVSAGDWDAMSARVLAIPHVYLPRGLWSGIAARLLADMAVSRGEGYQQRWEALRRLQGHPVAREAIAAAVAEMVADPAGQIVVDPLMLLVHDPTATRRLMAEVTTPTTERTLRAAMMVCELAAEAGRFTPAESERLATLARGYLADGGLPAPVRRAAADLLGVLRPGTRQTARPAPAERDPARAAAVASVTTAAETALDVTSRGTSACEDRMLPRLVAELLFRREVDVRLGAAVVLSASPFGGPIADALADTLSGGGAHLGEYADALGMIGGAAHRPALEELLTRRVPRTMATQAAFALGNLPGRTAHPVLTEAVVRHARVWQEHGGGDAAEVLRALVYAAGMQDARPVLLAVRRRQDLPPDVRAAARWWLARPTSAASGR